MGERRGANVGGREPEGREKGTREGERTGAARENRQRGINARPPRLRAPWGRVGSASPRSGPRPRAPKPREAGVAVEAPGDAAPVGGAAGRRGSRPRPAGRLAPAPPAPLPRAARPRAALWELWSPRSAARRRHRRGEPARLRLRLRRLRGAGRGRPGVRALGRRRRPGPSGRPLRPRARAQVSGGLPGLRGWRAARPGRSLRDGEEAAGARRLQAHGPHSRRCGFRGCSAPRILAPRRGPPPPSASYVLESRRLGSVRGPGILLFLPVGLPCSHPTRITLLGDRPPWSFSSSSPRPCASPTSPVSRGDPPSPVP